MDIQADTVLVYLGNVDERYSRQEQLDHCKKAVKEWGLPAIGRRVYEHNEIDELVESLRGTELVMLPRLGMLAVDRQRGVGKRFLTNLLRVTTRKSDIVDVCAGIASIDYDEWIKHIDITHNKLVNGRKVSSEEAKIKRALRNPRGLENHWTNHVKKTDPERFNRVAQHWRDPRLTADEAIEQSPDVELGRASRSMWQRVFGNRT